MPKRLVIVESPTKARTLQRLLGSDFIVESSMGHVRDLPANASEIPPALKKEPWARLGIDTENWQPLYVVPADKKKKVGELRALAKGVSAILLATDEDREGEAISWHLIDLLKPKCPFQRMVFHEITDTAILHALDHTRDIDANLVAAQEARRIIDRLYGYEVSPVLWRKVAPMLSAGRVQSVAIRMLVDRERERMRFKESTWWDLVARFRTDQGQTFPARLISVDGRRIAGGKDFDPETGKLTPVDALHLGEDDAQGLREALVEAAFTIVSADEKPFVRSPAPPFTTSSLQQEGNRKLRFDAKRTMRAAQRLYENGYITYMRTDSVALSEEALRLTRDAIRKEYGTEYLPKEPRTFRNKVKNAQEAHEAIRPAGHEIQPIDTIARKVGSDEAKIYELVWKRTMACQMQVARGRRMVLEVAAQAGGREIVFRANGSVIDFPGFLRAYVEGADDPEAELAERETVLPPVRKDDTVRADAVDPESHSTQPRPRLTEATLVKALEESGIGRPSTYASILDTIQRREYTFKKGNALVPTFTAFAVVDLMTQNLTELVDPTFTARMEDRLDAISRGEVDKLAYVKEFYYGNGNPGLHTLIETKVAGIDPREVCSIRIGDDSAGNPVIVRVGRYGPFLQRGESTAALPAQTCPDELTIPRAEELLAASEKADEPIGSHPETEQPVYVKTGRFGPYVQLGDADPERKIKPKMVSLLRGMDPHQVTLDLAVKLLELPRTLGNDAEGVPVEAYTGRYGPYIKRGKDTRSLEPEDDLLTIGLERALELLSKEKRGRGGRASAEPVRTFESPEHGTIKLLNGRYGPYVTDGETNASLPKDFGDTAALTLAMAVELLEKRRASKPARGGRRRAPAKKNTRKKPAGKTKAAKKKTARKKKPGKASDDS